ncbi:hypothetical protein ACFWUP_20765 [Nocardia sp. NPDC058658]|uniref:hypothetical protein n=1 Tax=Nocardia sp. NPDC058658 TaxID=3346580 RepID=UPI0036621D75
MSDHFTAFVTRHGLSADRTQWSRDAELDYYCERVELESEWHHKADILEERIRAFSEPPRIAPVVDGYNEAGRPLDRLPLMKKLHELLLTYLESAPIIWSEPGFGEDEFTPGEFDVPLNYRCDGAWIWADAVPHYFRKHEFCPHSALVDHIVGSEFPPIELSDERRRLAREVIARITDAAPPSPRLAHVYDGRDANGRPIVDRPPVPPDLQAPLLTYLESAPIILSARGFDTDEFTTGDNDVPPDFRTDGTWIWAGAVPHYLRKHGLAPEPDLIQHIIDNEFQLTEVDERTRQRALGVITGQ